MLLVVVVVCVVVVLWRPFKNPPCVRPRRPRVCLHHAHMLKHVCAWCPHTRGRFECTHGDVFESTHGCFAAFHTTTQDTTHKTHKTQHQQHTTTTTTTHGDMERRRRKKTEKEREEKTREDERQDEREEKMKDEREGKRSTFGADDNFTGGAELSY